jgi:hypothetical protein
MKRVYLTLGSAQGWKLVGGYAQNEPAFPLCP